MRDIEYERQLDVDTRMRARYQVIRRRVSRFIVQLEVLAEGKWRPVVRYDTSHKFAHRGLYRRRGRVMKTDLKMSFEEALTHALDDLRDNWSLTRKNSSESEYVERF